MVLLWRLTLRFSGSLVTVFFQRGINRENQYLQTIKILTCTRKHGLLCVRFTLTTFSHVVFNRNWKKWKGQIPQLWNTSDSSIWGHCNKVKFAALRTYWLDYQDCSCCVMFLSFIHFILFCKSVVPIWLEVFHIDLPHVGQYKLIPFSQTLFKLKDLYWILEKYV